MIPSVPFAVAALVTVSVVSLFLALLNFAFWRIHPEDRTPLWLTGWLLLSVAFAVGRLLQYTSLSDPAYDVITRLVLAASYANAWIGYQLANAFVGFRPGRREKIIVLSLVAIAILTMGFTPLVATHQVVVRTLISGGQFHGLPAGPLYLLTNLLLVAFILIAPARLLHARVPNRSENHLMAAGFLLVILCGIADAVNVALSLPWPRILDFSYMPMGMIFTYIQVSRLGRLHRDMDAAVREKTAELTQANKVLRDEVVERTEAQQALQVSEELYRMLFDANPQPAWVYDLHTFSFLLVNDAAVAQYGYARDEFLCMTLLDIRPSGEIPALLQNLQQSSGTLQWSGPWKHRTKDGRLISVEILSHALVFGGREARLVMANNVTERLQAEAALQESEEKYRTVVEKANDGITIIQDGRIRYANERLAVMRGESPAALIGRRFEEFVRPEELGLVSERHLRRMAGEAVPTTYETILQNREGSGVAVELTIGTISYQGQPAIIAIVRDISERRQTEHALHRQLRDMTVLNTVAAAGAQATHVDDLIERVTEVVGRMLYPDNCGVLRADERGETWHPHPSYQGVSADERRALHPLSEGIAGKAMSTGQIVRVGDIRAEPAYVEATPGIQSELAIPIIVNGRLFGCLNAESRELDAFTEHDEQLMSTIVESMSTAIEKIRLLQVEQRRREEAEILYNTTRDLVMERDLSVLLRTIVERAAAMVGTPSGSIDLCEPEARLVRVAVSHNTDRDYTGVALKYGEGIGGRVAETGQPIIVEDYRVWPGRAAIYEGDKPFVSVLAVPMRWQGSVIGVIHMLDNNRVRAFTQEDVRIASLFANQAAMAVENARLFREASQRAQEAAVIAEVGREISESLKLDVILERIASYAKSLLRARTCAVYLPNPQMTELHAIAALGPFAEEIKRSPTILGKAILGNIALQQSGEIVNNVGNDPRSVLIPDTEDIDIEHLMGIPVLSKSRLMGLIAVWRVGAGEEFTSGELGFLSSLAGQVAVAIENARLFADLQQTNLELSGAYDTTLEGWARALELRDKETLGHSRRVTDLTLRLARRLGVPESDLTHIRRGVLLHDIGKMGIPDVLLKKTGPLNEEEWELMRQHPRYAYNLLQPIAYLHQALDIPYAHHERWDGSGYPRGLIGEQIPLAARIFMVVDAYDALLNDRPYRKAWPTNEVFQYLRQEAGRLFDPEITEVFLDLMADQSPARLPQAAHS
jgi:PAS domain S-box-containing protein